MLHLRERSATASASLVEAINVMAPALAAAAPRSIENRNLVSEQVDLLFDSGMFWVQVPECLGGSEATAIETFEVFEALARVDGAVSWTVMATALTTGLMGVYMGDDAVAEVFADPRALSAGQVAPRGTAVREASGGVRVQGDFVFSSGSAHANWMLGGFREIDAEGKPVRLPNGMPNLLLAIVPKGECQMDDDWDVIGLEATGSVNYRIPEQVIGADFVWPLMDAEQRRGGAIYRMGAFGLTNIAHSAFSVGVARRALHEIAAIAPTKKRAGRPTPLVEDPVFQSDYGMAEAALGAARAGALAALASLQEAAFADTITAEQRAHARLATSHAAKTAVEVVGMAHRFAGSAGLRNGTAINQCFRDISASEAHVFTDHGSWVEASAALLTGTAGPFL